MSLQSNKKNKRGSFVMVSKRRADDVIERDLVADYCELLNGEARRVLMPVVDTDRDMPYANVHVQSQVGEIELGSRDMVRQMVGLGTHWRPKEKMVFFHYLARYSIHRVDEWCDKLPAKSKYEILLYYRVLKKNLEMFKGPHFAYRNSLLSRVEFPAAIEMDEFYVDLEESLSRRVEIQECDQVYVEDDEDQVLIDVNKWYKRWKTMYSKMGLADIYPLSYEAIPISTEGVDYMTKCCVRYTKKLVWNLIVDNMDKISVSAKLFEQDQVTQNDDLVVDANNGATELYLPYVVTKEDVQKLLVKLKWQDHKTKTFGEKWLDTVNKFRIACTSEPNSERVFFQNQQVAQSLLPVLVHNVVQTNPFTLPKPSSTSTGMSGYQLEDEIEGLVKRLYKMYEKERLKKRGARHMLSDEFVEDSSSEEDELLSVSEVYGFIDDDQYERMDNPYELQLCDWEEELMEQHDKRIKDMSQHILISYLTASATQPLTIETEQQRETGLPCPVPGLNSRQQEGYLRFNI